MRQKDMLCFTKGRSRNMHRSDGLGASDTQGPPFLGGSYNKDDRISGGRFGGSPYVGNFRAHPSELGGLMEEKLEPPGPKVLSRRP